MSNNFPEIIDSHIFHIIARNQAPQTLIYTYIINNVIPLFPPFTFHPLVGGTSFLNHPVYVYTGADRICIYTWPSVECHAIPFPSRRGQRGNRGSRGLLHPLRSLPRPPLLRPSILLASVGGAVTSDLPLPARLTDDSTPSHMQGPARTVRHAASMRYRRSGLARGTRPSSASKGISGN